MNEVEQWRFLCILNHSRSVTINCLREEGEGAMAAMEGMERERGGRDTEERFGEKDLDYC